MTIEPLILDLLESSTDITNKVGERIGMHLTDDGYPKITLRVISTIFDYDYEGDTGFRKSRLQLDIWAETYTDTAILETACVGLLSGHSDEDIQLIQFENSRSFSEKDEKQETIFRRSCDFICTY